MFLVKRPRAANQFDALFRAGLFDGAQTQRHGVCRLLVHLLADAVGNIGADSVKFMQAWMDRYAAWIKTHAR